MGEEQDVKFIIIEIFIQLLKPNTYTWNQHLRYSCIISFEKT